MIDLSFEFSGVEYPFTVKEETVKRALLAMDKTKQYEYIKMLIKSLKTVENDISKVLLNNIKKEL